MPKQRKNVYQYLAAGRDAANASNLAEGGGSVFSGGGPAAQRVLAAKTKITELTRAGVRINPNTATQFTRDKMREAASPRGRLGKLFFGRKLR